MLLLNRQRRVALDLRPLKKLIKRLAAAVQSHEEDFSVTLMSDHNIRKLNRQFRGQDGATDVLSFPAGNSPLPKRFFREDSPLRLGEIAISVDTARQQAQRERHSLEEEIKLLIIHGLLHLLGYDHETDHGEMNRLEYRLRKRLL